MVGQLGIMLMSFRDAFPRGAAFNWFVVAIVGFIVRLEHHGVSSSIRWMRIHEGLYEAFLAFFRSDAVNISKLLAYWQTFVAERSSIRTSNGALVLIGDGIKASKEAALMPGVKKLHQQSENSGKAPWIFGHHFGVIGILAGTAEKAFCIPLAAELHEGAAALRRLQGKKAPVVDGAEKTTVVTLMGQLLASASYTLSEPCVAVLDAFFSVGPMFAMAKSTLDGSGRRLLHIVTRAKDNAVAYELQPLNYCGRGRPPKYGRKINLTKLFASRANDFETMTVDVYEQSKQLAVLCLDLLWKPLQDTLRFILVKDGDSNFILMCSDLTMDPPEIVSLYARRFKIEVTFKMLKHLIGGFHYHFWTKAWQVPKGKSLEIENLQSMTKDDQRLIAGAMNAVETFVNLALISTGMLQLLAIENAEAILRCHKWWMRTYPTDVPSEEMVKTVIQHEFYHNFRKFKHTAIYRIIQDKRQQTRAVPLREAA